MEQWKHIPGYPGFEVSNKGRLRRDGGKPRSYRNKCYCMARVYDKAGGLKHMGLHRLVALAFLGQPPQQYSIPNHKNGIKNDNRPENLEWIDQGENVNHGYRTGLNRLGSRAKLTDEMVREIRRRKFLGEPVTKIADDFPVGYASVRAAAVGDTYQHVITLPLPAVR